MSVEGAVEDCGSCRAKGMMRVEGARIPDANHFVMADNPEAGSYLIERYAGNDAR